MKSINFTSQYRWFIILFVLLLNSNSGLAEENMDVCKNFRISNVELNISKEENFFLGAKYNPLGSGGNKFSPIIQTQTPKKGTTFVIVTLENFTDEKFVITRDDVILVDAKNNNIIGYFDFDDSWRTINESTKITCTKTSDNKIEVRYLFPVKTSFIKGSKVKLCQQILLKLELQKN